MPKFDHLKLDALLIECLRKNEGSIDILRPIIERFQHEFPEGRNPSPERPFVLSTEDIDRLLDCAQTYYSDDLLMALASMGTVSLNDGQREHTPDAWIGLRDKRIEDALIQKALIKNDAIKRVDAPRTSSFVYGLSGNPPTLDHLTFIKYLLDDLSAQLVVVLNAQSPLKALDSYVDGALRLTLLEMMLSDDAFPMPYRARCHLSHLEIDRSPPSRMVVTQSILTLLSRTSERYTLILGLDGLKEFTSWYQWRALLTLCDIKFFPRPGQAIDSHTIKGYLDKIGAEFSPNIHMVFNTEREKSDFLAIAPRCSASVGIMPDLSPLSATVVREAYKHHALDNTPKSDIPCPGNIHPRVHEAILKHGLFGLKADLEAEPAEPHTSSATGSSFS